MEALSYKKPELLHNSLGIVSLLEDSLSQESFRAKTKLYLLSKQ